MVPQKYKLVWVPLGLVTIPHPKEGAKGATIQAMIASLPQRLFALMALTALTHCSMQKQPAASRMNTHNDDMEASAPKTVSAPTHHFPPASDLDKVLDAKTHTFPEVKATSSAGIATVAPAKEKSTGGPWRIQVGSLPDLETAQAKKRELDAKLGGGVEMSFDPPYYKLRWGGFETRQEAEDRLLELSETIREGFVVRQ
jgi:cell division protein FtsN